MTQAELIGLERHTETRAVSPHASLNTSENWSKKWPWCSLFGNTVAIAATLRLVSSFENVMQLVRLWWSCARSLAKRH